MQSCSTAPAAHRAGACFAQKKNPLPFICIAKKKNIIRQSVLLSLLLIPNSLDAVVNWTFGLLRLFSRLVMPLGASSSSVSPGPALCLPPGKDLTLRSGADPPRPPFIQAPLWHSDAFPLPWVPTRSPLSPGVRVSGGAGTAGLSARNSPSGICSSVFSACVSAEPEGRDGRDCMGWGLFDCTEKVPGVNLHRRTPRLSSRVLVMVTGPRRCGHPAGRRWRFAWLHPRFISLMALNLWR